MVNYSVNPILFFVKFAKKIKKKKISKQFSNRNKIIFSINEFKDEKLTLTLLLKLNSCISDKRQICFVSFSIRDKLSKLRNSS